MPGSAVVCSNLVAFQLRKIMGLRGAMEAHGQRSLEFARVNHPWESQDGYALSGLGVKTETNMTEISTILGGTHPHNWYLENPLNCIFPYGNKNATPFGTRFRIIEMAIKENWSLTIAECNTIMRRF